MGIKNFLAGAPIRSGRHQGCKARHRSATFGINCPCVAVSQPSLTLAVLQQVSLAKNLSGDVSLMGLAGTQLIVGNDLKLTDLAGE